MKHLLACLGRHAVATNGMTLSYAVMSPFRHRSLLRLCAWFVLYILCCFSMRVYELRVPLYSTTVDLMRSPLLYTVTLFLMLLFLKDL